MSDTPLRDWKDVVEQYGGPYKASLMDLALVIAVREQSLAIVYANQVKAEAERDAALREVARLREASAWIRVGERLPDQDSNDIGDEYIVHLGFPYDRVAAMYFQGGEWYTASLTKWTDNVVEWMPLPTSSGALKTRTSSTWKAGLTPWRTSR